MFTSLVYGLIAGVITWFFMYLDSRLFDNPKTKGTYWKNVIFVTLLVTLGIRALGESKFNEAFGFSQLTGGAVDIGYLDGLGEEILTGKPNF
jgi:hypothetical protein